MVAELIVAVKDGVVQILESGTAGDLLLDGARRAGWETPSRPELSRGRGHPRNAPTASLLVAGIVEDMFESGAKPFAEAAHAISEVTGMSPESAYRRMKAARTEVPMPARWTETLWCERIQPLFVQIFAGGAESRAVAAATGKRM